MRILYLTPWFPIHPEDQHGNFIFDSVKSLIDIGHEVTVVVTTAYKPKVARLIDKNWQVKKIQIKKFPNNINFYTCRYLSIPRHFFCPITLWNYKKIVNFNLKKIIAKHKIQLIHAQAEYAGMAAVEVGKQLALPTVITLHGISTEQKLYRGKTRKLLFEYPLNYANRIVLVGQPLFNFAKQFVNHTDHFHIIPNGFRFSAENSIDVKKKWPKNLHFISVSNLEEGKGLDINLHALAKLNQLGINNWTYKIVGNGSERKYLESLRHDLKLTDHVTFLGALTHDDVYKQLVTSDVFILPSYREAFGIAYLEAMSCGLLTIGVEDQGPEAFIQHGKTGFLVTPRSVSDLLQTLKFVFASKDSIKSIAEAGQRHVQQYFTWHQHAIKLTNLYQSLIKE